MSLRSFHQSLYLEHFDELASMGESRAAWLADGESSPQVVAGLEQRIEAHLDALVLGGASAMQVAEVAARPEQPWSFYAWVALACRADDSETLHQALEALQRACDTATEDVEPVVLRRAVTEALVRHAPTDPIDPPE